MHLPSLGLAVYRFGPELHLISGREPIDHLGSIESGQLPSGDVEHDAKTIRRLIVHVENLRGAFDAELDGECLAVEPVDHVAHAIEQDGILDPVLLDAGP